MALARCEQCGKPQPNKRHYVNARQPVGYPNTALICGRKGCHNPGLVWLEQREEQEYQQGTRIFSIPNAAAKLKLA
jgi:hypothetical protein